MKQIIIQLDDGSYKDYNRNAFREVIKIKLNELKKEMVFVDMTDHCKYLGIKRLE